MWVEESPSTRPRRLLPKVKRGSLLDDRSSVVDIFQRSDELYIVIGVVLFFRWYDCSLCEFAIVVV